MVQKQVMGLAQEHAAGGWPVPGSQQTGTVQTPGGLTQGDKFLRTWHRRLGDQSVPSPHIHYPAGGRDPVLSSQWPGLMTHDDPEGSEGGCEDRCAGRVEGRPGLTSPGSLGERPLPQTWPWKGAVHSGSGSRAQPPLGWGNRDRRHKKVDVQSRSKGWGGHLWTVQTPGSC